MSKRSGWRNRNALFVRKKGQVAWMRGQKKENEFLKAVASCHFKPHWFVSIRKATYEEDKMGIDFIIYTNTNPSCVYVQIKSSFIGEKKFWKKHSPLDFQYPLVVLIINFWSQSEMRKLFFKKVNWLFD